VWSTDSKPSNCSMKLPAGAGSFRREDAALGMAPAAAHASVRRSRRGFDDKARLLRTCMDYGYQGQENHSGGDRSGSLESKRRGKKREPIVRDG